jgi:HEAT repeats
MNRVVRRAHVWLVGCSLGLAIASPAAAQAPVINAVVEHRAVGSGALAREVQSVAQRGVTAWVGYKVDMLRGRGMRLDTSSSCCGRCRLQPPTDLVVLARVESRSIVEVRPVAVDCDIDAGGAPLVWFDNVRGDDSVSWLSALAKDTASRRVSESALTALALHADRSASDALVTFARRGETSALKGKALFWLAQRAADQALPTITAAIDNDPDTAVKKQAVFALSQMPKDEAVPRLIELARNHANLEVRRQAMFWLGQSKDPRAIDFFAGILLK